MSQVVGSQVLQQYYAGGAALPGQYGVSLDWKSTVGMGSAENTTIGDLLTGAASKLYLYPGLTITDTGTQVSQWDKGARYRIVQTAPVPGGGLMQPLWHAVRDDNKRITVGASITDTTILDDDNKDYLVNDLYLNSSNRNLYRYDGSVWSSVFVFGPENPGGGTVNSVNANSVLPQGLSLTSSGTEDVLITLAGVVQINLANELERTGILPLGNGGTGSGSLGMGVIVKQTSGATSLTSLYHTANTNRVFLTQQNGQIAWTEHNYGVIFGVAAGLGLTGGGTSGTVTIAHPAITVATYGPTTNSALSWGAAFSVPKITTNGSGHVASTSATITYTLPTDPTTYLQYVTSFNRWIGGDANGPIGEFYKHSTAPIQMLPIPLASSTASGVVSAGTAKQVFAGPKQFNGTVVASNKFTSWFDTNLGIGAENTKVYVHNDLWVGYDTGNPSLEPGDSPIAYYRKMFDVNSLNGNIFSEGGIHVSKYARSGLTHVTISSATYNIDLSNGNSFFLKFSSTTPTTLTLDCTHPTEDLYNLYLGGSFIITIYNDTNGNRTVTLEDQVFKGFTTQSQNNVITLSPGQSMTYSGVIMGTSVSDCDFYGIISDGIANLKI